MTSDYPPPAPDAQHPNQPPNQTSPQAPAGAYVVPPADRSHRVGAIRHLLSVVVALVCVPLAYVGLDYAMRQGLFRPVQTFGNGFPPAGAMVAFVLGVALLLVAASAGRLSGLGPLAAGVVWGVLPGLWILLAPASHLRFVGSLPDPYNGFLQYVSGYGLLVYPVVAALLLGCAVSARWR